MLNCELLVLFFPSLGPGAELAVGLGVLAGEVIQLTELLHPVLEVDAADDPEPEGDRYGLLE